MTSSELSTERDAQASRRAVKPPVRARIAWVAVLVVLSLASLAVYGRMPSTQESKFSGSTMGTSYRVTLAGALSSQDRTRVAEAISAVLAQTRTRFSTHEPTSELSRFNRSPEPGGVAVSNATLALVDLALGVSRASHGAFDPSVGPLVELWGFGASEPTPSTPTQQEIASARRKVGYAHLATDHAAQKLVKRRAHVRCDLSAIAKGQGIDDMGAALEALGHRNFLIEIGGELLARGRNGSGRIWRVGVESPDPRTRDVATVVELADAAIATSGSYRNFRVLPQGRVSHLIDPRTGHPVKHSLVSVSVVHARAALADAWATALHVLGQQRGYELAVRRGLAARFVARRNGSLVVRVTPGFPAELARSSERGD